MGLRAEAARQEFAATLLDAIAMQPALHVSQRYPASRLCAAPVLPLARHPRIDSRVIVFDLEGDADALLALDADEIADRLYTPAPTCRRAKDAFR
jgi:exodeoxyribonuclease-1